MNLLHACVGEIRPRGKAHPLACEHRDKGKMGQNVETALHLLDHHLRRVEKQNLTPIFRGLRGIAQRLQA